MKTPRSGAASLALALLFVIGVTSMSVAKTFVYVSNAQDGNIDAYIMDMSTGALTPIGKTDAAKLVMPMAVSPNKKHSLCRHTLAAGARIELRHRSRGPARSRRKHRRRFPTACPMFRPIALGVSFSPPPMAATSLR